LKTETALIVIIISHLSILFNAVEDLLGHQLFQVRYRRLRAAADEAPLQVFEVIANALQAHVHLLVQAMEVGLGVRVHHLLVVVLVVLRDVLGARHVPALIEVPLPARFIWSGYKVGVLERRGMETAGLAGPTFLQLRHQFVHNVLHGAIEADVLQGMGLVDDVVAGGAGLLLLQVLHQAALAD